jgi:hypothetical protein
MLRSVRFAAAIATITVLFSAALPQTPSSGSQSIVPAVLTKDLPTARTLPASYMLTRSETEALAVSNRGKISLHGGYKTTSAIDRKHRIALVERVCCARTEFFLFRTATPVSPDTVDASLSALGIKGITVGATDAAVIRRFGRGGVNLVDGSGTAQFIVNWNDHCTMRYTLFLEHHLVQGISARDAC